MKVLIVYYSKSGNTKKVAETIKSELVGLGCSVDTEEIKPVFEHNILVWQIMRIFRGECNIVEPKINDVSAYDAVIIGSPNWTRVALPIAKYLRVVKGLEDKKVGFFATTAMPPSFEQYILSAYLLDLNFSKIIRDKKAEIVDKILLSSALKRWSFSSQYGKKLIKNFCQKIKSPPALSEKTEVERREINVGRFMLSLFIVFYFIVLSFQVIFSFFFGKNIFTWNEFFVLSLLTIFSQFFIIILNNWTEKIYLSKYVATFLLIVIWTALLISLRPFFDFFLITGYVYMSIVLTYYRNTRIIIFAQLCSVASYFFMYFYFPIDGMQWQTDLSGIFWLVTLVAFVARSLQEDLIESIRAKNQIEESKMALEVKINARTRELRELAESLEAGVKQRTKELQEKIEELEKFQKMSIGRELRMIELKKELENLRKTGKI